MLAQTTEWHGDFFVSWRLWHGVKSHTALRTVTLAALVAAVGQVTLGGLVRVTGSGLGCPDWPLCDGRAIPSLEFSALIEYAHRLSAIVLGILVLATVVLAWRFYRGDVWITVSITAALAFVVVAAILGGITVLTELAWWIVLVHLGTAELAVACLVVAVVAAWSADGEAASLRTGLGKPNWYYSLLFVTLVGLFAVILFGSYMVGRGYGSACGVWPLCNGTVLPQGEAFLVHMSHRIGVALVGVLIAGTVVAAWSRRTSWPGLRWVALAVAGFFAVQVVVGAATVWTDFSLSLKSLHLSVATLLWMSLVFLAAITFAPQKLRVTGLRESHPESVVKAVAP